VDANFCKWNIFCFFCFLTKDILLLTYVLCSSFFSVTKEDIFENLLFVLFMVTHSRVDGCKGSSRLVDCCCCDCLSVYFFLFCNIILFTMNSLSLTLFLLTHCSLLLLLQVMGWFFHKAITKPWLIISISDFLQSTIQIISFTSYWLILCFSWLLSFCFCGCFAYLVLMFCHWAYYSLYANTNIAIILV